MTAAKFQPNTFPTSLSEVTQPVSGAIMHKEYVKTIGRMAYVWGWAMVNSFNRRAGITQAPEPGRLGSVVPVAPRGRLCMLNDYVLPKQSFVACPNQDVAYGVAFCSLDEEPIVLQVPDFGDRFWVYALYDARTDQFGEMGRAYGTEPGFYLLVGPNWAGQVPFISTNDALSSWFFREMKCDLNSMVANFRSREPSVLGLTELNVGNYEANVPYFPGDVETPALIRQSIRSDDGGFRARRAGSPPTKIPKFKTLIHNKSAIVTNWASFYRDVDLQDRSPDNETSTHTPKLHLPIMETDGLITSVWHNGVIFCPRAGELGMFMITRRFDSDMLTQQKAQEGSNVPMGARIV